MVADHQEGAAAEEVAAEDAASVAAADATAAATAAADLEAGKLREGPSGPSDRSGDGAGQVG